MPVFDPYGGGTPVAPAAAMHYMRTFFGDLVAETFYTFWLYNTNPGNHPVILHNCPGGCIGYELTADLDLKGHARSEGYGWDAIGTTYNGVFEGNGHTISNLYIDRTAMEFGSTQVGLFANLGADAFVRGVGLRNVNITAIQDVGGPGGLERRNHPRELCNRNFPEPILCRVMNPIPPIIPQNASAGWWVVLPTAASSSVPGPTSPWTEDTQTVRGGLSTPTNRLISAVWSDTWRAAG